MSSTAVDANLAQLFDHLDTDNSGSISLVELRAAFKEKGISADTTKKIFNVLDIDKDGNITREEYFTRLDTIPPEHKAIFTWFMIFERYDKDHSGYLDKDEFGVAMEEAGLSAQPDEVSKFFKRFDLNSDEKIDFKEFLNWKASS